MVHFNVDIGAPFKLVTCGCGEHPVVTEYSENYNSWRVGYTCDYCDMQGGYSMIIPLSVRQKEEDERGE